MKSNAKLKIIILITLGILFALALRITINPRMITSNNNVINFDNENLKISATTGKIHIDNNWTDAWSAGICTGNGTYSEPYVIEDLVIDAGGSGSGIFIENSDVYFRIENCTLYNAAGWTPPDPDDSGGIRLLNVDNSQLINNNCSSNPIGILLASSDNNTISENIVNNNSWIGIFLIESDNNIISGNTVNNNTAFGLCSPDCFFNNISTNVFKNNNIVGIYSNICSNLTISGNTVINSMHGIFIANDMYDNVLGNDVHHNSENGIFIRAVNCNISGNNASYNGVNGIFLEGWWAWESIWEGGVNNTISGNIANYNQVGIRLEGTDNNIISGNTLIGNDKCIVEIDCHGNEFKDNEGCRYPEPLLEYFPIILIISTAVIGVSVFMIYKNGKMFKKPQEDLDFL